MDVDEGPYIMDANVLKTAIEIIKEHTILPDRVIRRFICKKFQEKTCEPQKHRELSAVADAFEWFL